MMGLTPRQRELLIFLRAHVEANGISPSFKEMRIALGVESNSGVLRLVEMLEGKGYIWRLSNRARAIEVLKTEDDHRPDCDCLACAQARYFAQLQLIQAIKVEPPVRLRVALAKGGTLKPLDPITRADLIGKLPRMAVPRERTVVPSGKAAR